MIMRILTMLGATAIVLGATGVATAQPTPPGAPGVETANEGAPDDHPAMRGGPPGMHPGMMRMMRPSRAARFHFSRNDGVVDVKCAEDEPMRACVDAASALLDKLAAPQAR